MAEVFGIVTGVLGLLPLCRSGIGMVLDVMNVSKSVEEYQGRVRLQQDQYITWAEIWKTPAGQTPKFELYEKENPDKARRVLFQLGILSRTLFNAQQLQKHNGLKLKKKYRALDQDSTLPVIEKWEDLSRKTAFELFKEKCNQNMSFIRKCEFVLKDQSSDWARLIELLKEYMVNLRTFVPEPDLVRLLKAHFNFLPNSTPDQLRQIAAAAGYEGRHSTAKNLRSTPYHEIEQAAIFSAVVKSDIKKATVTVFSMSDFVINDGYSLSTTDNSTMALLFDFPSRNQRRIVLIEWIDIGFIGEEATYHDVKVKANMLRTVKPTQLLLPDCYGIVVDSSGFWKRYGLILVPPLHIRTNFPVTIPRGFISQKRKPATLSELISQTSSQWSIIDLGIRFRLAKRLIDSVHMMHCVGWVHKNIRSGSIIVFPKESKRPSQDAGQSGKEFEYEEPNFVGFGNARQDKVTEQRTDNYYSTRPNDIRLDYYQHPAKRDNPNIRYSRSFDIYSLGCVLLEIARWHVLEQITTTEGSGESFKRRLLDIAKRSEGLVGTIYARVIFKCLNIDIYDSTKEDTDKLASFCTNISAELDGCVA